MSKFKEFNIYTTVTTDNFSSEWRMLRDDDPEIGVYHVYNIKNQVWETFFTISEAKVRADHLHQNFIKTDFIDFLPYQEIFDDEWE